MTQINRYLSVWTVPYGVQLHQTDAYGHVNDITILNPEECQALGELLLLVGEPATTEHPAVAAVASTDWSDLTKAEIVEVVEELYGVTLDRDVSKATLVTSATKLEQESSK